VRDQLANQKTELAAFEAAQKKTVLREEELTARTNELRLSVATEQQRHENLLAQREPMSARDAERAELIAVRKADIAMYGRKLATQAEESRESETLINTQTTRRDEAQANGAENRRPARHTTCHDFRSGKRTAACARLVRRITGPGAHRGRSGNRNSK